MSSNPNRKTWDGRPISPTPPFGATVVVFREEEGQYQVLLLHRAHQGPDYKGDWAWTPPSGARYPGEAIRDCALRELAEETGFGLAITYVPGEPQDWHLFFALLSSDGEPRLSEEHDRYQWVSVPDAMKMCQPAQVANGIGQAYRLMAAALSAPSRGNPSAPTSGTGG